MQMLRECVLLVACLTTSLRVKYTRMGNALIIIALGICVCIGVLLYNTCWLSSRDGAHIYLYTCTTHLLLTVLGEITSYL